MKKLILIFAVLVASAFNTVYAAMPAKDNTFFKELADEIKGDGVSAAWNGTNLIITTDPDPMLDNVTFDADDIKMLRKSFVQGLQSSQATPEELDVFRSLMKKYNVHIIVNIMGTSSKAATIDISWQDF